MNKETCELCGRDFTAVHDENIVVYLCGDCKVNSIICPLCHAPVLHELHDDVHTWACTECPCIVAEIY